jgi:hypothetical protein
VASAVEERRLSKYLHKVLLIILKYTPITIAIIDILHTILSYLDIPAELLSFFGGIFIIIYTKYVIANKKTIKTNNR